MEYRIARSYVVGVLMAYMAVVALLFTHGTEHAYLTIGIYGAIIILAALGFGRLAVVREQIRERRRTESRRKGRTYYGRR